MTALTNQRLRLARLLKTRGLSRAFVFRRPDKNKYGEPLGTHSTVETSGYFIGYFYTRNAYVGASSSSAAAITKNRMPMLMLPDVRKDVRAEDRITIDNVGYIVNSVENFQNVYLLISLREGGRADVEQIL